MIKHDPSYIRYHRQIILPEWGDKAQYKLLAGSVLVIGAGGLGCPVLQYLAAAGVGCIGIADGDIVSLSNLHRQVLFGMEDIGQSKASVAARKLKAINPNIEVKFFAENITPENGVHMMRGFDIIVDGSDNFATRYLVNDACVLLQKPLVFGAISRFEGQVAVFNVPSGMEGHCIHYRDLFPHPPKDGEVLNCAEAGVIGVLPGIIGSLMANEVLKLISGVGKTLAGSLLTWNTLTNQSNTFELQKRSDSDALVPGSVAELKGRNYQFECGILNSLLEIDKPQFLEKVIQDGVMLIDVRELNETPEVQPWNHQRIPLSEVLSGGLNFNGAEVIFICQSGKRSLEAAMHFDKQELGKYYSLKGGVSGLL